MNPTISLKLQHSYAEQLPDFFASVAPAKIPLPGLLQFNKPLADELGIDHKNMSPDVLAQIFSGQQLPSDARPIAQAYAGHQFGNFVPQLGDGRALLLGEVIDQNGNRRDIAFKGSGRTPFSRGGDGKAVVGPVLREYIVGEAMHALGIPTTRALAAVTTGEPVMRERPLPGAILTRVAASHVRVGTFQYFAARRQTSDLQKLVDYVVERHYPEVSKEDAKLPLSLLKSVAERQAALVARWMLNGFIHGVMNTDNMAISGETIDYGPCAFMESYDPGAVFSSIDHAGRYAYANQPSIALWNLARFAETLLPLLADEVSEDTVDEATAVLQSFMPTFLQHWYEGAKAKLGMADPKEATGVTDAERELIDDWLELLQRNGVDFTLAWRHLAEAAEGNETKLRALFNEESELDAWLSKWQATLVGIGSTEVAVWIRAANPLYIPRNHLVEEALAAASEGDIALFENLLEAVRHPFDEKPEHARYATPASEDFTANYRTFCGT